MNKKFNEVFYDEFNGIESRFRNHDFYIIDEHLNIIEEYVKSIALIAKEKGFVDAQSLKDIVRIIEVLGKSNEDNVSFLLDKIYFIIEQINLGVLFYKKKRPFGLLNCFSPNACP